MAPDTARRGTDAQVLDALLREGSTVRAAAVLHLSQIVSTIWIMSACGLSRVMRLQFSSFWLKTACQQARLSHALGRKVAGRRSMWKIQKVTRWS